MKNDAIGGLGPLLSVLFVLSGALSCGGPGGRSDYTLALGVSPGAINAEVGATVDVDVELTVTAAEGFGIPDNFTTDLTVDVTDPDRALADVFSAFSARNAGTEVIDIDTDERPTRIESDGANPHEFRMELRCMSTGFATLVFGGRLFFGDPDDEDTLPIASANEVTLEVECVEPTARDRRYVDGEGRVYNRNPSALTYGEIPGAALGNVSIMGGTNGAAGTMVVGLDFGPPNAPFAAISVGGGAFSDVSPSMAPTGSFDSVATDGTNFVAVGNFGTLRTPDAGSTWFTPTTPPGPDTGFNRRVWFGGAIFVTKDGHRSSDGGDTWIAPTTPPPSSLGQSADGAFLNGIHVLLRGPGGPSSNALSSLSTDGGDTWSDGTSIDITLDAIFDVAAGAGVFVAGGTGTNGDARIVTSTDGSVWADATLPIVAFGEVRVIQYSTTESLFLAAVRVNQFVPYDTVFLESDDGLTWAEMGAPLQDATPAMLESLSL